MQNLQKYTFSRIENCNRIWPFSTLSKPSAKAGGRGEVCRGRRRFACLRVCFFFRPRVTSSPTNETQKRTQQGESLPGEGREGEAPSGAAVAQEEEVLVGGRRGVGRLRVGEGRAPRRARRGGPAVAREGRRRPRPPAQAQNMLGQADGAVLRHGDAHAQARKPSASPRAARTGEAQVPAPLEARVQPGARGRSGGVRT